MTRIAGIITRAPAAPDSQAISRMVTAMSRESDRSAGCTEFARLSFHAGWSANRRARGAAEVRWNENRTVGLLFSGEENSIREAPDSAVSPLIRSYEAFGEACFAQLNGWFSGVIVDLRRDTVTLFNDRYGLSRVYYAETGDGFHFASEAKSLLAVLPHTRGLDPRGLAEFLSLGCVLQNRSLYSGISLLPPASCWTFHRDGRVEKRRYFDPAIWEQSEPLDVATYAECLKEVFQRVAHRCAHGHDKVALSLTGGLDSRLLLAWLNAAPGAVPCYTFGGPVRDCADVQIARQLAGICHQPHTTLRIDDDFFQNFASLAEKTIHVSDGAMDVSGAVELYINQKAREIAPVRLTGNYGSEILRANVAFRPRQLDRTQFVPEFADLLDAALETYREESAGHRLSFIAFKQVPWFHYARYAVERSELTPRSPFLDNELVALAYRAPFHLAASAQPLLQLVARGNPGLASIGTDRALKAEPSPALSQIAHAWQEFTAKAEYAYDYGMPQWLARADCAVSRLHLEKLFLGRHKFYHFRVWYRDQLKDYLSGLEASAHAWPSCYRERIVRQMLKGHLSGSANHTLDIHRLVTVRLTEQLIASQR